MIFVCKECGLKYTDKDIAEKCEKFCKKYKACDPEITRHATNKRY